MPILSSFRAWLLQTTAHYDPEWFAGGPMAVCEKLAHAGHLNGAKL